MAKPTLRVPLQELRSLNHLRLSLIRKTTRKGKVVRYLRRKHGRTTRHRIHTEERKRAAKRSGQGTATASSWKSAYDNLRRVRARAVSQKVCYCCGSNQHHLAICPDTEKKNELMNSFSYMEDTMGRCFTEDDKAIIRRDVES